MNQHTLLNYEDHKTLRIITKRSPEMGDQIMHAPVFPHEFRSTQAHYPILFHEDTAAGHWQAVALFGFERGENLFLKDDGWEQAYLPLSMERQPFLIGFQADAGQEGQRVIHFDSNSPRLSDGEGEPLFDQDGNNTPFLDHMATVLETIHQGVGQMRGLSAALDELDLLETLTLDIELNDGSKNRLAGFSIIHEEKLAELSGEKLAGLQAHGFLMPIYMAIASLSQLKPLIDRKNRLVEVF